MVIYDCGKCKNCKDKKRFGGPGIKKKACERKEKKHVKSLYILSKIATMILDINKYKNSTDNSIPLDALLLLNKIIQFDNEFIKCI